MTGCADTWEWYQVNSGGQSACRVLCTGPGYLPSQKPRWGAGVRVLDNHFHAVLRTPERAPSAEKARRRYRAHYDRKRPAPEPWSEECARTAENMRDISWFMHDLQQQFACWFNRTRPVRRRGTLWAARFKNTLLQDGRAVWDCWKYIEMNSIRAGLSKDPAEYRFSSFGIWSATGKHPFGRGLRQGPNCLENRRLTPYGQRTSAQQGALSPPAVLYAFKRLTLTA